MVTLLQSCLEHPDLAARAAYLHSSQLLTGLAKEARDDNPFMYSYSLGKCSMLQHDQFEMLTA